jgi:hypothetical protein
MAPHHSACGSYTTYIPPPRLRSQLLVKIAYAPGISSELSAFSMIGGGLAILCRKMCRLMK